MESYIVFSVNPGQKKRQASTERGRSKKVQKKNRKPRSNKYTSIHAAYTAKVHFGFTSVSAIEDIFPKVDQGAYGRKTFKLWSGSYTIIEQIDSNLVNCKHSLHLI